MRPAAFPSTWPRRNRAPVRIAADTRRRGAENLTNNYVSRTASRTDDIEISRKKKETNQQPTFPLCNSCNEYLNWQSLLSCSCVNVPRKRWIYASSNRTSPEAEKVTFYIFASFLYFRTENLLAFFGFLYFFAPFLYCRKNYCFHLFLFTTFVYSFRSCYKLTEFFCFLLSDYHISLNKKCTFFKDTYRPPPMWVVAWSTYSFDRRALLNDYLQNANNNNTHFLQYCYIWRKTHFLRKKSYLDREVKHEKPIK